MSMMDLQSALGGAPGGGPPSIPVPPPEEEAPPGGGTSVDYLDDAEEALHQFIQVDPDEADRAEAAKALQIILKLKAANQSDAQAGGMKSLQRALGGTGGPAPAGGPPLGPGGPPLG